MLFVNNVAQNGSHEQKRGFLPDACSGASVCGMCMSEPGAGTDVMGMSTTATHEADGTGDYVLNGQKMWITNGTIDGLTTGDAFLVYARTGEGRGDVSSFLVSKGAPGFSLGQKIEDKCGMRASMTAELVFDNVRISPAMMVGEEHGAALCMMRNLEIERITLAAMSVGIARRSLEVMNAYASERKAFGAPINQFGQIQKHIADSYAEVGRARAHAHRSRLQGALGYQSTGFKLCVPVAGRRCFCFLVKNQRQKGHSLFSITAFTCSIWQVARICTTLHDS